MLIHKTNVLNMLIKIMLIMIMLIMIETIVVIKHINAITKANESNLQHVRFHCLQLYCSCHQSLGNKLVLLVMLLSVNDNANRTAYTLLFTLFAHFA